mgnify:CR=1 FL=1
MNVVKDKNYINSECKVRLTLKLKMGPYSNKFKALVSFIPTIVGIKDKRLKNIAK